MSSRSDISVVMPCRNCGPWIADALRSIGRQAVLPRETIIIDDGSTDDTVAEAKQSGVPVKIISARAGNAAVARNIGIKEATGEWVAFLDGDDIWHSHHLEWFGANCGAEDVAWYSMYNVLVNGADRPFAFQYSAPDRIGGLCDREALRLMACGVPFATPGMIVKRSRIGEIGGFDESQVRRHDCEFFLRAVEGHTWSFSSSPSWSYRQGHGERLSNNSVDCAIFQMRAWKLNRQRYRGDTMSALLSRSSAVAVGLAMREGSFASRRRAVRLAWQYLPVPKLIAASFGVLVPRVYQIAARAGVRVKEAAIED